jgi:hypothetical protein
MGGAADRAGAAAAVPLEVLRAWDQAEASLFPVVMARPELYQQVIGVIQGLAARLRETCRDLPALLAAHGQGAGLLSGGPPPGEPAAWAAAGLRPEHVAAAACAMRYRELAAELAARARLEALAGARAGGRPWAVVEESGSLERVPPVSYQRVEADVTTGRAVIVSASPDETLSRAVYRLDLARLDPATGALQIGDPVGSYPDPAACDAALQQIRDGGSAPG